MDEKEIKSRLRRASESLYGDSRLRDGLTDEQAERLLAWGFGRVEDVAAQVQTLPAAEASERIENRVQAVHDTLHLVNQMVARLPSASQAQTREYAARLVKALWEADARRFRSDEISTLANVIARREALASAEIFERLLAIVDGPGKQERASAAATRVGREPPVATQAPTMPPEAELDEEE